MKKWFCLALMVMTDAYAVQKTTGVGRVATNLMEPVSFASDFIYSACFVIGGSFLLASIVKYIDYRRNPFAVPISTVVFLFIAGAILLALPFAYLIINDGTPYSLFR